MKKILTITLLVIVLAAVGWWFFFHKSVPVSTPGTTGAGNPFGTAPGNIGSGSTPTGSTPTTPDSGTGSSAALPTLFKISADPVANGVIFLTKDKHELVRYVDRANGHIYEVDPATLIKTELENTTAPKVYEALWKADGTGVITRTLKSDEDTISNTALTLIAPKTVKAASTSPVDTLYSVSATDLRGNITSPVLSPSGTSLAYVLKDTGGVGISGFNGDKPRIIYSSAFNEWQLAWSGANLVLTTNASRTTDGFAYLLNTSSGALSKILGPLTALTTKASPDGSRIVYSYIDNNATFFSAENMKSKTVEHILPTTLSEKCVWSTKKSSAIYCGTPIGGIGIGEPDDWYQGTTHFVDQIWKFDTDTGIATLLAEPKKSFNASIDLINPSLSPNEDYLLFMNKIDLSLWALKIQ